MAKREDIDLDYFKEKLEEELSVVERELEDIGQRNPDNRSDWEAKPTEMDKDTEDPTGMADSIEEYEENTAVLKELETRYNNIKDALAKIENGTYGFCEIGGEPIEEERLIANQAARTCKKHMN